jgi:hypothetical protein
MSSAHAVDISPVAQSPKPVWDARLLQGWEGWRSQIPSRVANEFYRYLDKHSHSDEGLDPAGVDIENMPAMRRFGEGLRRELLTGGGIARVGGLDAMQLRPDQQRFFYAALGMSMGRAMTEYGYLYPVHDRGLDYKSEPVPVSMTREETGMHTDSSSVNALPDFVGLLCEEPSLNGGDSLVVNALNIYWRLRVSAPEVLEILEGDFIRDVVTPGVEKSEEVLLKNSFPIFSSGSREKGRTFRYMRYWIEKGHDRANKPLSSRQIAALNILDEALASEQNLVRMRLGRGEMLWVNNRTLAHGREGYFDTPGNRRHFQRMWIEAP